MTAWTAESNEALHLKLVRSEQDASSLRVEEQKLASDFHPKFTYPIFGEEEKIYGYSDLKINLWMASGSLRQFVSLNWSERLTGAAIDDPENTLYQYLPDDRILDEAAFKKQVEEDAVNFKPLGEKIYSYVRRSGQRSKDPREIPVGKAKDSTALNENEEGAIVYEVYHVNWSTPGFLEYHRRMQIFILLYIEAGSYIQEDEDKWEFVTLFEKRKRKDGTPIYHFVGYSSLYPFYFFPDSTRLRLSQFVIAGPYQKQGHGASLYKAIHDWIIKSPRYAELTVEDPSEDFEDLRDKVDLRTLLGNEEFTHEAYGTTGPDGKLSVGRSSKVMVEKYGDQQRSRTTKDDAEGTKGRSSGNKENRDAISKPKREGRKGQKPMLGPPTQVKWAERWRKELKFAKRQYDRLIEMLILRALDPEDEAAQRAFRLQVKGRLKAFNFETLMQLDQEEQYDKLEETFQSVKEGYKRILAMIK